MKIITISREFGSGGRELGKRLADALGVPCYDREIIKLIAEQNGFDESYVSHLSEKVIQVSYPMTIGRRFVTTHPVLEQQIKIISSQREILRQFAQKGDCVIVGRCADIILRDMKPMNIFVYADQQAKIDRCIANGKEGENLDPKVHETIQKMLSDLMGLNKIGKMKDIFHKKTAKSNAETLEESK